MDDGQRLTKWRTEKGLNIAEAARRIGSSRSYLSRLERGMKPLGQTGRPILEGMAQLYDKTLDEVTGMRSGNSRPRLRAARLPILETVPCNSVTLKEGVDSMSSERFLEVAASQVTNASHEDNLFVLEARGNHLIGDGIADGDFLIVDKGKVSPLVDGRIYVVCIGALCMARHIYKKGKRLLVQSSSDIMEVDASTVEIQGKVIKVNRMRDLE